MITQQSFMFISSYGKLREFLRQRIAIETMPHVGPRAFEEVTGEKVNTTLLVFRHEPNRYARHESVGTYFRLVKEPVAEAKRRRFELAIAHLFSGQPDPVVYRYRQGDFDAIPSSPLVYWISSNVRQIFESSTSLGSITQPRHGMATGDNSRFLRFWWEVGASQIAFRCESREEAISIGKKWFPCMKGGGFRRWYGNQEFIVNYWRGGFEMMAAKDDGSAPGHRHDNRDFYFLSGITYSHLSSRPISFRILEKGFVFEQAGSCLFPSNALPILGILNSSFVLFTKKLINPTVNFQVGSLAAVPMPGGSSAKVSPLVNKAILAAKSDGQENETTYDFIAPPSWQTGINNIANRRQVLADIEQEIDEEVYRLYGISDEDRVAVEAELAEPTANETSDEESENLGSDIEDAEAAEEAPLTREELACRWISYAVGIVIGRFQPGIDGALGRGHFSQDIAAKLRALANSDGILVLDQGHPDDLATKVLQALQLMLGQDAGAEVVVEATGQTGNPAEELRGYFERSFFKEHLGKKKYRKRPVYWLLQSPRKMYSVWLFHEKLTKDTLYRIRGEQYVASKIRLMESRIGDLRLQREAAQGRERRTIEKQMAELEEVLDDLRAFAERIDAILQRGYTPHIHDGVLINMAPLWELMPSWQAEPKKCWDALARGDYDWSHQAMDHWPERVRQKCQTNKSYAIAHGLV